MTNKQTIEVYPRYTPEIEKEIRSFAAELKSLCKDFSDLRDRPYMGDVHSAIDGLLEHCLTSDQPAQEVKQQREAVAWFNPHWNGMSAEWHLGSVLGEKTCPEFWKPLYAEQPTPVALTVWYGSMPESNGKTNWTAILHRKGGEGSLDGITIDRSEYPDRVRYEADRMRYLIGELADEPFILDYDADKHSGYVKPERQDPVAVVLPERKIINVLNYQASIGAEAHNACIDEFIKLNGLKP